MNDVSAIHPPPTGRRRRLAAWSVITLLPLVAWIALLVQSLGFRNEPVDTGDALSDWYLMELVTATEPWLLEDSLDFSRWYGAMLPGRFGMATMQAAEAEFEDDPRYWILLYHNTMNQRLTSSIAPSDQLIRQEVLEEAQRRGAVNAPILLTLLKTHVSQWEESAAREVAPPTSPQGWSPAQNRADIWAIVDQQHGDEYTALVGELLKTAPQEAQVYYHLALNEADRGNHEAAIAMIAQGNRAPENTSMQGHPAWLLCDTEIAPTIYNDMLVGGWVGMSTYLNASELIDIKKSIKHTIGLSISNNDIDQLTELHKYSCRILAYEGSTSIHLLTGLDLIKEVRKACQSVQSSAITPEQQASLNELDQRIAELTSDIKLRRSAPPNLLNISLTLPQRKVAGKAWDAISLGQAGSWLFIQDMHHDLRDKMRSAELGLADRMADLARFNYSTLAWDDEAAALDPTE